MGATRAVYARDVRRCAGVLRGADGDHKKCTQVSFLLVINLFISRRSTNSIAERWRTSKLLPPYEIIASMEALEYPVIIQGEENLRRLHPVDQKRAINC
jgi:hypothetical protein